jgi:hypothetical protein
VPESAVSELPLNEATGGAGAAIFVDDRVNVTNAGKIDGGIGSFTGATVNNTGEITSGGNGISSFGHVDVVNAGKIEAAVGIGISARDGTAATINNLSGGIITAGMAGISGTNINVTGNVPAISEAISFVLSLGCNPRVVKATIDGAANVSLWVPLDPVPKAAGVEFVVGDGEPGEPGEVRDLVTGDRGHGSPGRAGLDLLETCDECVRVYVRRVPLSRAARSHCDAGTIRAPVAGPASQGRNPRKACRVTFLLRVVLPDRPGSLGAVATAPRFRTRNDRPVKSAEE